MPAVAKKAVKSATPKQSDVTIKPKKQSLKKTQKTAEIKAAKKLAKLKSTKAISDKLNRAPAVKKQKAKHQFDPSRMNRGVVLIKNLPKGFFEQQLEQYFSQYGQVTRLRLARSERTGGSKGFAYVEFKYPDVAKVAAQTMNDYLMFRQRLKTVYIPPDQQDHDYFHQPVKFVQKNDGTTKLVTPTTKRAQKAVDNYNKPVSAEAQADRAERSRYKLKFLEKKLAKAGINIDLSSQIVDPLPSEPESQPEKKTKKVADVKVESSDASTSKPLKKGRKNFVTPPTPEPVAQKKKAKSGNAVKMASEKVSESGDASTSKPSKKVRTNFVTPPTPEPVPQKKKAKLNNAKSGKAGKIAPEKVIESSVAATAKAKPLGKVRTNFVTPPTPEPAQPKKKAKLNKVKSGKVVKTTPDMKIKSKLNAGASEAKLSKKIIASSKNVAPINSKQSKKGLNKKK